MSTTVASQRHPWLAVFLSLIMPGLGQIYCGALSRGLLFLLLSNGAAFLAVLALIPRLALPAMAVVAVEAVALVIYLGGILDAFRFARRTTTPYQPKEYNRWYVYAMLYLAVSGGHLFSALFARDHLIQPFKAGSASMYPTIWTGDQVMAAKHAYLEKDPVPGDIVIFKNPDDRSQVFVKRVVAVAGDVVEMRADEIFINGNKLARDPAAAPSRSGAQAGGTYLSEINRGASYQIYLNGRHERLHDFPTTKIPAHTCFVLGDNRDESLDSRSFGPIPITSIVGRVDYRYAPLANVGNVQATRK